MYQLAEDVADFQPAKDMEELKAAKDAEARHVDNAMNFESAKEAVEPKLVKDLEELKSKLQLTSSKLQEVCSLPLWFQLSVMVALHSFLSSSGEIYASSVINHTIYIVIFPLWKIISMKSFWRNYFMMIYHSVIKVILIGFFLFLQADHTITKLTKERSAAIREKDILKHEVVSNLLLCFSYC